MDQSGMVDAGRSARSGRELIPLYVPAAVAGAAGCWYLLKELAPLLRPLMLAVFLAYTILPVHRRLSRRVPATLAGLLLALLAAVAVLGGALLVYGNLVDLKADLPHLIDRGRALIEGGRAWARDHLPAWVIEPASDPGPGGADTAARSRPSRPGWSTPRRASWPRCWSWDSTWRSS